MLQPSHITFTEERTFIPLKFDGNIVGRNVTPPLATAGALSRANKGVTRNSRNIQSHMTFLMVARPDRRLWSVVVFCLALLAFVAESELTQYVQTTLNYRHPFFLLYTVHSSFSIIFPLHLLYLTLSTKCSPAAFLEGLRVALLNHLSLPKDSAFPVRRFLKILLWLTLGVNLPGLLWFAAVSLAPISDVTAIWNTNAFFAYLIAVKVFGLPWQRRRLASVLLATLGVVLVVYGGTASENSLAILTLPRPSSPLLGDLLTLVASVTYAIYQVLYKKYAALPSDPEEGIYEPLSASEVSSIEPVDVDDVAYPPPFALHPNMLTSAVGLFTMLLLWIPIPALHFLGLEPFALPPNLKTLMAILGISLSGVIFNSGFMILLGVWGPIITSVGGLLTIVLVFLVDVFFGAGIDVVTTWSVLGCCAISFAFVVLVYDIFSASS